VTTSAVLVRSAVGFVLGAVLAVFAPPLSFAIALVLAGVVLWGRLRNEEAQRLTAPATGFLLAVGAYVLLAVLWAIG
jgi:inner membrane protein involved in colicin E2 resistance